MEMLYYNMLGWESDALNNTMNEHTFGNTRSKQLLSAH